MTHTHTHTITNTHTCTPTFVCLCVCPFTYLHSVEKRVEGQGVQYSSLAQGEDVEVLEAPVAFGDGPGPVDGGPGPANGDRGPADSDSSDSPATSVDNPPEVKPSLIEEAHPLSPTRSANDDFDLRMDRTS